MTIDIVVPLDGSTPDERACPVAKEVADRFGGGIVLLHVGGTGAAGPPALPPDAYLGDVQARFGIPGSSVQRAGTDPQTDADAVAAIEAAVAGQRSAVLCIASLGRTGLGAALFGGRADAILRASAAPTLLVGPEVPSRWTPVAGAPIVYGFDGSPGAEALEPLVLDWAGRLDSPVLVTLVVHHDGEYLGDQPATAARTRARSVCERLTGSGVDAEVVEVDGLDPARGLVDLAVANDASLIVAAAHAHAGIVHQALGSVAMRVTRHAPCPVLVRHPANRS